MVWALWQVPVSMDNKAVQPLPWGLRKLLGVPKGKSRPPVGDNRTGINNEVEGVTCLCHV